MSAIKALDNSGLLERQDANCKFASELAGARKDYANDPAPFVPHERCSTVVEFLFSGLRSPIVDPPAPSVVQSRELERDAHLPIIDPRFRAEH